MTMRFPAAQFGRSPSRGSWQVALAGRPILSYPGPMNPFAAHTPALIGAALGLAVSAGPLRAAGGGADAAAGAEPDAAQKAAEKWRYHLFRPTPDGLLRDFNADRPSKSDSPITVDAGRFQIESDFYNFSYDRYNPERTDTRVETVLVPSAVLKVGLLPNADFQLLLPAYARVRTSDRAPGSSGREVATVQGAADMLVRLKVNFIGNEGGALALGFVGFVKPPTANHDIGNGRIEGGFSLPVSLNLPAGFNLFGYTRLDVLYNGDNDGHHELFSNNLGLTRAVPGILDGRLGLYAEFASSVSSRSADLDPLVLTADTGLVFQVARNVAVDLSGFFGLTRAAPDVNVFGGIAVRF